MMMMMMQTLVAGSPAQSHLLLLTCLLVPKSRIIYLLNVDYMSHLHTVRVCFVNRRKSIFIELAGTH